MHASHSEVYRSPNPAAQASMIEPPWLLPTQKVTGVVELSTNTRRTLVDLGSRYSVNWPVLVSSRVIRSLSIDPVQASPFLIHGNIVRVRPWRRHGPLLKFFALGVEHRNPVAAVFGRTKGGRAHPSCRAAAPNPW